MQAVDQEVLSQVSEWLGQGQPCWLATIIKTYGSSPRPVGSVMACNQSGVVVGSLSGGCVEDDLLEQLKAGAMPKDEARVITYGLNPGDTERLGLPCGGQLRVLIEFLPASSQEIRALFQHVSERLNARQCVRRTVRIPSGAMQIDEVETFAPLQLDEGDPQAPVLTHTYGPRHQLFLIGAGMVSYYLAQMAQALDFQVTVCDPREALLETWKVPGTKTICAMPDDAVRAHAHDPMTAIVALTHDPRIDDMGLMDALRTDAFYIGAMGSQKTSDTRRKRLKALDLTDVEIDRLRAPVGLPIGSKTPPEIAVAILAEITAVQKQAEARVAAAIQERFGASV